jgi:hypothetical protein
MRLAGPPVTLLRLDGLIRARTIVFMIAYNCEIFAWKSINFDRVHHNDFVLHCLGRAADRGRKMSSLAEPCRVAATRIRVGATPVWRARIENRQASSSAWREIPRSLTGEKADRRRTRSDSCRKEQHVDVSAAFQSGEKAILRQLAGWPVTGEFVHPVSGFPDICNKRRGG